MYGDWNYGTQKINVVLNISSIVENLNDIEDFPSNFEFFRDEDSENSFFTPDEWVEINGNAAIKIQKLITFVIHYKVLWYAYQ